MRLSLRFVSLTLLSAALMLGTAGLAAAHNGGPGRGKQLRADGQALAAAPRGDSQSAAAPSAAGAQGATTQHGGCQIPGLPDPLQGNGNLVLNPNDNTNFTCHADLPAGTPAPDRPTKVDLGDCTTMVTPSGNAKTSCHSKP